MILNQNAHLGLSSSGDLSSWEHLTTSVASFNSHADDEAVHENVETTEQCRSAVNGETEEAWDASTTSIPFLPKALDSNAGSSDVALELSSATSSLANGDAGGDVDHGKPGAVRDSRTIVGRVMLTRRHRSP